jgi:hypothetical protein
MSDEITPDSDTQQRPPGANEIQNLYVDDRGNLRPCPYNQGTAVPLADYAALDAYTKRVEADRDRWCDEVQRLRAAKPQVPTEVVEAASPEQIIEWLEHHQWTHTDWATWFEANPSDERIAAVGSAEYHREVEARYSMLLNGVRNLVAERDLAIARDRQPYPTLAAYAKACKALQRAKDERDAALAREARLRDMLRRARSWLQPPPHTEPRARYDAFHCELEEELNHAG